MTIERVAEAIEPWLDSNSGMIAEVALDAICEGLEMRGHWLMFNGLKIGDVVVNMKHGGFDCYTWRLLTTDDTERFQTVDQCAAALNLRARKWLRGEA